MEASTPEIPTSKAAEAWAHPHVRLALLDAVADVGKHGLTVVMRLNQAIFLDAAARLYRSSGQYTYNDRSASKVFVHLHFYMRSLKGASAERSKLYADMVQCLRLDTPLNTPSQLDSWALELMYPHLEEFSAQLVIPDIILSLRKGPTGDVFNQLMLDAAAPIDFLGDGLLYLLVKPTPDEDYSLRTLILRCPPGLEGAWSGRRRKPLAWLVERGSDRVDFTKLESLTISPGYASVDEILDLLRFTPRLSMLSVRGLPWNLTQLETLVSLCPLLVDLRINPLRISLHGDFPEEACLDIPSAMLTLARLGSLRHIEFPYQLSPSADDTSQEGYGTKAEQVGPTLPLIETCHLHLVWTVDWTSSPPPTIPDLLEGLKRHFPISCHLSADGLLAHGEVPLGWSSMMFRKRIMPEKQAIEEKAAEVTEAWKDVTRL